MKKAVPNAKLQISLKILLMNNKGKFLLLRNRLDGSLAGTFDFPGGRIAEKEIGMPFDIILRRELIEELGPGVHLSIKPSPIAIGRHKYTDRLGTANHVVWLLFPGTYKNGAIKISSEHISYQWKKITKSNLKKLFIKGALDVAQNLFKH
ncbi:MAG: hypothetical protein UX54_C0014G0005 [Parcubacteria group bacterium GW2011_GWA2_46_39]|nr:MAG: hypothetical protein UX54_C0014G0005 [Parcubacteria group bacterium GW2011_GWA2_46_39]